MFSVAARPARPRVCHTLQHRLCNVAKCVPGLDDVSVLVLVVQDRYPKNRPAPPAATLQATKAVTTTTTATIKLMRWHDHVAGDQLKWFHFVSCLDDK